MGKSEFNENVIEAISIEKKIDFLERDMKDAGERLKESEEKEACVVHHNDADGLSSAFLIQNALQNLGFEVESCCLERTYLRPIREICGHTKGPVIFVDLGSRAEAEMAEFGKDRLIIVLDHHGTLDISGIAEERSEEFGKNFFVLNCTRYGINGDTQASSSTLAYRFCALLDEANKKLAHIGIIGPIGDKNNLRKGAEGGRFNEDGYDIRVFREALEAVYQDNVYWIALGKEAYLVEGLAVDLTVLGSVGYKEEGPLLALDLLRNGYSEKLYAKIRALKQKRQEAYDKVIEKIRQKKGLKKLGDIVYFDTEAEDGVNLFAGMGTKTIGDFCNYLIDRHRKQPEEFSGIVDPPKYLMGSQRIEDITLFGQEFPIFDPEKGEWVKISIRTAHTLQDMIKKGERPAVERLVAQVNPNYSDGCHDERGATVVPKKRVDDYLEFSQRKIHNPNDESQLRI
jgi:hypothetical protein